MAKYTKEEREKFKRIPEAVWAGLHQNPKSITRLEDDRDTRYIGDPDQVPFRNEPVWSNKPDLDAFVSEYLDIDIAEYGSDMSRNTVYKRIANEISKLRREGRISDWRYNPPKTNRAPRYGIWRPTMRAEVKAITSYRNMDYTSPGSIVSVVRRAKQVQFRNALLESFRHCLFCEFRLDMYLRGAHIVPFSVMQKEDPKNSMNPANGLLLCTLCDVAFERGDITVDEDYNIRPAEELVPSGRPDKSDRCWITNVNKRLSIRRSCDLVPDPAYLRRKMELNESGRSRDR